MIRRSLLSLSGPSLLGLPLLGLLWALAASPLALAAERDPDWPCVQILVPTLSPGQIWAGDPIEGKEGAWHDVPGLEPVLKQALDRSADADRIEAAIGRYADGLGSQRNEALTLLFAGAFETLNRERGETIAAIRRYARQQHALLDRIAEGLTRMRELPQNAPEAEALAADIAWQRRILDERRRYQSALCDQPVQLEQRLGLLARTIAAHLD